MTTTTRHPAKRRPRGEGSIKQLPDGRWWTVRLVTNGRKLRRTRRTQAEALAALDELKRRAGMGVPLGRYSVGDALTDFLEHGRQSRGWAPATTRAYTSAIESHIRPRLGRKQLADLSVRDAQAFLDGLLESGQSAAHVRYVRGVLRTALAHAMRQELIVRNVASLASVPQPQRPEIRALSASELHSLISALDASPARTLLITAAFTGMRRGELIALRWDAVDLDRAELRVRRTGTRIKGEYTEGPPKSAKSRRTIALAPALVTLLRSHATAQKEQRLRLGPGWQDEDRVFPGEDGGPIGATTIRKALDRALERAGLPHLRIHDLRHTAATTLLAAGGTIRDVQEMLGHASYAFTADTYAHVLEDQRRASAERMQGALGTAIAGA
jgi:integrase